MGIDGDIVIHQDGYAEPERDYRRGAASQCTAHQNQQADETKPMRSQHGYIPRDRGEYAGRWWRAKKVYQEDRPHAQ
jgi:hypothetical protein